MAATADGVKTSVRNMCFTMNNPVEPLAFDESWMSYLVYQKEVGENQTPHYQGYVESKKAMRLSAWRKVLPGCHLEVRRGTQEEAKTYCTKTDTRVDGPWEHGTMKVQGKRNDLVTLVNMAREGRPVSEALDAMPAAAFRYYRNYIFVVGLVKPPARWEETVLYVGPPGTGKTRKALHENPEAYVIPVSDRGLWFDGYDGQDVAVIDDFKNQIGLVQFLRVIDRYPAKLPTKGGHVWWNPRKIVVTSNYNTEQWYDYSDREESLAALNRRFTSVLRFSVEYPWEPPAEVAPEEEQLGTSRKRRTSDGKKRRKKIRLTENENK